MPKLSDHAQRRREILTALFRIAATRALHTASMRTVAAEAGVSVSTVQCYFHSKEQLLFAGLQHAAESVAVTAATGTRSGDGSAHSTLETWLSQLIPATEEQRAAYTVYAAYHALSRRAA